MKLAPFQWVGGVQNIPNKDVEAKEANCDKEDDQQGEQQERPG